MRVKTIEEQLKEMGIVDGSCINFKSRHLKRIADGADGVEKRLIANNPFAINLKEGTVESTTSGLCDDIYLLYLYDFEVILTYNDIYAKLKENSRPYKEGEENYYICYHIAKNKAIYAVKTNTRGVNELYFDRDKVIELCEWLNSNPSLLAILFDNEK